VEKSQYELCVEVLHRLDKAGILKNVVLVGSWCTLFYKEFFSRTKYMVSLKTRDNGQGNLITELFHTMPRRWQGKVKKQLANLTEKKILDVLQ